jgi:hypothetical protein
MAVLPVSLGPLCAETRSRENRLMSEAPKLRIGIDLGGTKI